MNRRGEENSKELLYTSILLVVILGVFLAWQAGAFQRGGEDAQERICRHSIQQHSVFVYAGGEHGTPPLIKCEPRQVTIKTKNGDEAARALADELVFCWQRWQEGDVQLFKDEGTYCNPCSVVTYNGPALTTTDFYDYLDRAPYGNTTLRAYLFPQMSEDYTLAKKAREAPQLFDTSFEPGQEYAVVFWYDKQTPQRGWKTLVSLGISCLLRSCIGGGNMEALLSGGLILGGLFQKGFQTVVGDSAWLSTVLIVPNEGDAYRGLGCADVYQQGVPDTVDGAENI